MRRIIAVLSAFLSVSAVANVVHVYEKTLAGGVETQIADRTLDTGRSYLTQAAPTKSGYIFTHWTISTQQTFFPGKTPAGILLHRMRGFWYNPSLPLE